jgi:hypothetical protein
MAVVRDALGVGRPHQISQLRVQLLDARRRLPLIGCRHGLDLADGRTEGSGHPLGLAAGVMERQRRVLRHRLLALPFPRQPDQRRIGVPCGLLEVLQRRHWSRRGQDRCGGQWHRWRRRRGEGLREGRALDSTLLVFLRLLEGVWRAPRPRGGPRGRGLVHRHRRGGLVPSASPLEIATHLLVLSPLEIATHLLVLSANLFKHKQIGPADAFGLTLCNHGLNLFNTVFGHTAPLTPCPWPWY